MVLPLNVLHQQFQIECAKRPLHPYAPPGLPNPGDLFGIAGPVPWGLQNGLHCANNMQMIDKNGKPEWAIIPYEEYQRLLAEAEMLQDIQAYDEAKLSLVQGEELIPSEVTFAILDGESPIRVWREHRGMTQQQVAEKAGISKSYLSQLESGQRRGTTEVLSAVARVLDVSLEDLVTE
jgi:DNA-binding XRE family transcriptional regulator